MWLRATDWNWLYNRRCNPFAHNNTNRRRRLENERLVWEGYANQENTSIANIIQEWWMTWTMFNENILQPWHFFFNNISSKIISKKLCFGGMWYYIWLDKPSAWTTFWNKCAFLSRHRHATMIFFYNFKNGGPYNLETRYLVGKHVIRLLELNLTFFYF